MKQLSLRTVQRVWRAQWRDMKVLLRESRTPLMLFILVVVGGATLLHFFYTFPEDGRKLDWGYALYASFALVFFETALEFPQQWYLQVVYFLIPILGLSAIADGVLSFSAALTNKRARGQKWQVAMASTYKDHVIVCGLGKVGYRVVLELQRYGRDVVGIEANPEGRFVERLQEMGIPLILADARRSSNLIKANVKEADAIIPCTDDELTNLDIALDAREINPRIKVVMRMFDPDLAKRVQKGFGIHTAISTSALAAPIFAAAAMRANVKYSFYVDNDLLNIGELTVQPHSKLVGRSIGEIEKEYNISVIIYQRSGFRDMHPEPAFLVEAGAKLTVLAELPALQRLEALNQG